MWQPAQVRMTMDACGVAHAAVPLTARTAHIWQSHVPLADKASLAVASVVRSLRVILASGRGFWSYGP